MKLKLKKILIVLLIFSLFITPIYVKGDEEIQNNIEEETVEKGDLRCPLNDSEHKCQEIKDNKGKVDEVRITEKMNDIEVTKYVKKTNTLGRVSVKFSVKGNNHKITGSSLPPYIVVLYDTSRTISGNIDNAKNAIIKFSKAINEKIPEYKIGLVQFATRLSNNKKQKKFVSGIFDDKFFCGYTKCNMGQKSQVEKALAQAQKMFSGVSSDYSKYLVIFGDGRYWYPDDTLWNSKKDKKGNVTEKGANQLATELRKSGVNIYGIHYNGSCMKCNTGYKACKNVNATTYPDCDIKFLKQLIVGSAYDKPVANYFEAYSNDFETQFIHAAKVIIDDYVSNETTTSGILDDNIGNNFESDDGSLVKSFKISSFSDPPTEAFDITINPYVETGWYKTNENFKLTYKDEFGNEVVINSDINPEVYWLQEVEKWKSCNSDARKNIIVDTSNSYFTRICEEGYNDATGNKMGFSANLEINKVVFGAKAFNIKNGIGFPATISIDTNVKCYYKFNKDIFESDYQAAKNNINLTTDEKEQAIYYKQLENMNNLVNKYLEYTDNDYSSYVTDFTKLQADFKVIYDSSNFDSSLFENDGNIVNSYNCINKNPSKYTINLINLDDNSTTFESVLSENTCYFSLGKKMILKKTCLDMKNGEMTDCINNETELYGGHSFYTDLSYNTGKINVNLSNAGFSRVLNIKLEGEDCEYNNTNGNIYFRQVDIDDPFIQQYDSSINREIGKNYLTEKYDFTNIIKKDVWSNDAEFKFLLSKENIENIRNSTLDDSEKANSYFGSYCHITSNKKYECDFTRNRNTLGNEYANNFFSKVDINDDTK